MDSDLRPIDDVARELGIDPGAVRPLGRHKAKIALPLHGDADGEPRGRLVLVSAIGPTKVGEGKTTVSVGLADGLRRIGRRTALCLREPSLGPVFGIKGGGTGGGRAQVEPATDINLHFTGDMHAVTSAHNLLAALIDTDLHFGGASGLTPDRVTWPRVLDVNDRALRKIVVSAGRDTERASRFDITAASEIMAVLALAASLDDLRARLARIVVGTREDGSDVTADDLGAVDAMVALLRDALEPNLVQTREGCPAFVHAGPFGNIAHGCNSVVATRTALRHAEEVVTEAGFGFDLGGEKFLDIKMRQSGLWPRAVVLVATVRALASHGDGDLARGLAHLDRQLANVRRFGLPAVVAINVFAGDEEADLRAVEARCDELGAPAARITSFVDGGAGGVALAERLLDVLDAGDAAPPRPCFLYPDVAPLDDKIRTVATRVYGAASVTFREAASRRLDELAAAGYGHLPICMAKTHLSFAGDPKAGGLAEGFDLEIRSVRLSAGAGFVVPLVGTIVTMPALPRDPAAKHVRVAADGTISGLMQGE